jgi:hypothetical protein
MIEAFLVDLSKLLDGLGEVLEMFLPSRLSSASKVLNHQVERKRRIQLQVATSLQTPTAIWVPGSTTIEYWNRLGGRTETVGFDAWEDTVIQYPLA